MVAQYITKHCLFCEDEKCLTDLYPQTFKDEDINADVFSARRVTEHFHYKMVKCSRTGLVFSRDILPDSILEKLYADSKVTFSEYTDIIRKDYWKPLEKFSDIIRKGAALEIGCSNGFFLEELKKQGFKEVHGCEPGKEAKDIAPDSVKKNIHTGFFTNEVYKDNTFDLICCFQTLDHLSDPLGILSTCYNKLKPGGLIYIIVHNVDGLQAKIFGEKSPIIDVEHIYLFNPKTLSKAVEKAGFKTVKTFPIKNSYPMEYWISHAPLPFKKQFHSIFKILGLNKIRIPLSLGNMGIVAVKK
jgi:2-polyprenyl-3-methyl-5-hydroxy-6-metoxy-1,4-benzoquinol methylase